LHIEVRCFASPQNDDVPIASSQVLLAMTARHAFAPRDAMRPGFA
jgi:hypothetical protein